MYKARKQINKRTRISTWNWAFKSGAFFYKKVASFGDGYSRKAKSEIQSRVIHELRSDFKLSVLLEATKFPKSTYMYWQQRFDRPNKDKSIEEAIKSIFEESKEAYGYRRVTAMVRKHGFIVNQKKVRRLMKKLNLKCVSFTRKSRKYNSYKGNVGTAAPNRIKQRFSTKIPYQKITTDTSEFKIYTTNTSGKVVIKKAYFDVFLDMYNGEVLSYRMSERPNA